MIARPGKRNRRVPSGLPPRWPWFAGAFLAVAALLAAAAGASWILDPRHLPIREVRVVGDFTHLSPARLQQVVAARATGGFFSVDVESIRTAVMSDPWVRDVSVRRVWPDSLQVRVTEQHAVAYWGTGALVNEAGQVFRPPASSFPTGLLQLSGPDGSEGLVMDRYRQLKAWFRPLGLSVDRVELNSRRAWSFELRGGVSVIVGRDDFDARVRRLLITLPRSIGPHLRDIASVDLRYTNGFAVRPRTNADKTAG